MKDETKKWLAKIAKLNGVTKEEVLKYLKSLSRANGVIHHLKLG